MRCSDCQFIYDCSAREPDTVCFKLCGTRITKLADIELKKKLATIEQSNSTEVKA